ncbi:MAG: aspartate aminotransferase family protein [Myxococcota bacterium]|nr:aspartate aminotransferase family protein [Myxococcota bacterium]
MTISRSEGAYLYTPDPDAPSGERRILDAAGGAVVANVGHGRREVGEAFARASAELTYAVPPFATDARVELIERLRESWLPPSLTRAVFTSGGSESVDAAIRLARQHHLSAGRPSRWKVIGRDLSYHGVTLATLDIGGHTRRRESFEPYLSNVSKAPACYCLRCPLGKTYPGCEVACATAFEEVIEREGPETIAAVIAEPIGGSTAGALVPPDEYWPKLVEIAHRHGILVIADEVMTGFGRTGLPMAVNHWGIEPDILVGGKGLTGGYAPMGGIFTREDVIEPIARNGDELMFFTYSAHPASCAAATAVLRILEDENLVSRAAEMGARLHARLAQLESHPHVAEVRGRGLLQAVEIVKDSESLDPFPAQARVTGKIVAAGLSEGVFFYPGGCDPARDVITLGPPFIIGDEEIEAIGDALEVAIESTVERVVAGSS